MIWLTFLSIHFGKNKSSQWNLLRNVYGGLLSKNIWTWTKVALNPQKFRSWLDYNQSTLKTKGNFGNHRKYESLNALKHNGTGAAVESYVNWVGKGNSHQKLIQLINPPNNKDPKILFKHLYTSMNQVARFGRTARFDYLTMIGKLGLAPVEPDLTYMSGATGPVTGANLLFGGCKITFPIKQLDNLLILLESHLGLYFGMQVLEDALCNWQKSPSKYIHFVG